MSKSTNGEYIPAAEEVSVEEVLADEHIGNEGANGFLAYLNEIGTVEPLTEEQTIEYLTKWQKEGDIEARNEVVKHNLKLVVAVAKKFCGESIEVSVQEGNLGLIEACDKFDLNAGTKFATCAWEWIRYHIIRANQESDLVRLPVYLKANITKVKKAIRQFECDNYYLPDNDEVARLTGLSIKEVREAVKYMENGLVSLNDTVKGTDGEVVYGDTFEQTTFTSPEEYVEQKDELNMLDTLISKLSERERVIIRHSFGLTGYEQMTYEEIGNMLGCSKQAVEKARRKAIEKMGSMVA